MVTQDYILNGQPHGPVAQALENCRFNPDLMRPFFDRHGRRCVTINTGQWKYDSELKRERPVRKNVLVSSLEARNIYSPVFNATALSKEQWLQLDTKVVVATRYPMRAWSDLEATSPYGGFNGWNKMLLEWQTMTDPGEAVVDMDGLTQGRTDAPRFQLEGVPLPLTHSDFYFPKRILDISRASNSPLDTVMGEASGRRVGETIEKTLIGNVTGITYGGASTQTGGYGRTSSVYGYINFGARLTKTNLTTPTGTNPSSTVADVLAMRQQLYNAKKYGPYMLYHSNDWDNYLDNDYYALSTSGAVAPNKTLRERLRMIDGIQDVRRLDFLFSATVVTDASLSTFKGPGGEIDATPTVFTMLMVSMEPNTVQAVTGMDVTVVQWESVGGLRVNFKTMCIKVPRLMADFYGNCGILHATTS